MTYQELMKSQKKNKYGNSKVIIDGIKFDSELEGKRYKQLKLLERAGEIKDLQLQVPYILQESYRKYDSKEHKWKTIQAIKYVADFVYFDIRKGKVIVEDTKSEPTKTAVFKIKKKIFEYKYQNLELTEVTKNEI